MNRETSETAVRLAVCAAAAAAVIYAAEKLCTGKEWPLWEKYGPWLLENRLQAIALVTAVLYGVSFALWPSEKSGEIPSAKPDDGFSMC